MTENKVVFCHELGRLIGRCTRNIEVEDIRYEEEDETEREFAVIYFVNGYKKRVCITGDSCLAIMNDVYNALV